MGKEQQLDITPITHSAFPVSPFDDIAEGPGLHVSIGNGTAQIFPGARTARAELSGDRARMTSVTGVAATDGALTVYAESDDYRTAIRLDRQSLTLVEARKGATLPSIESPRGSMPGAGQADAVDGDAGQSSDEQLAETRSSEDRERIALAGRIGYKPQFRTTPKGTVVGSFSLAVHPAPGETTWHKIVLFGSRAEKLRERGLGKGDEVGVVGYPHERERTDNKTGRTKTINEVYAAVVKRPKETEQQKPGPTEVEGGADA